MVVVLQRQSMLVLWLLLLVVIQPRAADRGQSLKLSIFALLRLLLLLASVAAPQLELAGAGGRAVGGGGAGGVVVGAAAHDVGAEVVGVDGVGLDAVRAGGGGGRVLAVATVAVAAVESGGGGVVHREREAVGEVVSATAPGFIAQVVSRLAYGVFAIWVLGQNRQAA